jgi:hypothetical protein
MGRFEIGYLLTHFIARAEHHGCPCAFVTFQKGGNEWCLDVMRHKHKCPTAPCTLLSTAQLQQQKNLGSNAPSLPQHPPVLTQAAFFSLFCAAQGFQGWWYRPAPIPIYLHPKMGTTLRFCTNHFVYGHWTSSYHP